MIRPGTAIGPMGRCIEDEEVYRNNPAITNSSINLFCQSERLFYDAFVTGEHKRADTPALIFGRAFHCYILEPQQFSLRYAIWDGKRRQGKEWDGFKAAEHGQRHVIDRDDMDLIVRMARSIDENDLAAGMLDECDKEVVFRHMCGGNLARQCRVDGISRFGPVIDLKSCDSLSEFKANFKRYGYHRQARWYTSLAQAVTGDSHEFTFIAVEKKPPYAVGLFVPNTDYYGLATMEINAAMDRLEVCLAKDEWKRDEPEVQVLEPKKWDMVANG